MMTNENGNKNNGVSVRDLPDDQVSKTVSNAKILDDGYYDAVIDDVRETTSTFDGETHDQYEFHLTVYDGDGDPVKRRCWAGRYDDLTSKQKLYSWLMKLGQPVADDGYVFNPKSLLNLPIQVHVEQQPGKEGKVFDKIMGWTEARTEFVEQLANPKEVLF